MKLDIRVPIGVLFSVLGAILIGYGLLIGPPTAGIAVGVNLNAWWGAVLMAFGVLMLWLARRTAARHNFQPDWSAQRSNRTSSQVPPAAAGGRKDRPRTCE